MSTQYELAVARERQEFEAWVAARPDNMLTFDWEGHYYTWRDTQDLWECWRESSKRRAASAAPAPSVGAEPMFYAFKHNLGYGNVSWTFHSPAEQATAYRDTCLEVVPLYAAPSVPAVQGEAMTDAEYIKTLEYEVARMGNLHRHAETRHANLLMDLHRLAENEATLNDFDEVNALKPLVDAGRYGHMAFCPACFEQVTPEQRAALTTPATEAMRLALEALAGYVALDELRGSFKDGLHAKAKTAISSLRASMGNPGGMASGGGE